MAKLLSASAFAQYHRDGFYVPIRVLSREEAAGYSRRLETYEAERGGAIGGELRHKTHLLFTWLDRLVRHPRILDAVEDVLGPNLLCWSSSFFIKEANDAAYVSWHQDATYWGLSQPDVVTAWLAFTDATVENGAMRMVPGSHVAQVAHRDTFAPTNLLSRSPGRARADWSERRCPRRAGGAPGHLRSDQSALARPGDRGRGGRGEGRRHPARGREHVAPPRAHVPQLATESLGRSPHRLRHPLHPDVRAPGRR